MTFDAKTNTLRVKPDDLSRAYGSLMWSLQKIRETAGLPLDKYEKDGPLEAADYAMKGILDAMENLGIEVPAQWGNEIDLRDIG